MTSHVTPIRAIGGEFLRRKWKGILTLFTLVSLALSIGCVWLITISAWWWLFAVPVFSAVILGIFGLLIARLVIGIITPKLSRPQQSAVADFVDKLERVAERAQTPPFWIVFKVIRDVIWPRNTTFIQDMAQDSTSLKSDYEKLLKVFSA